MSADASGKRGGNASVRAVDVESRAYRLGIRSGDRLSSVNGSAVATSGEFARIQESAAEGVLLEMVFRRGLKEEPEQAIFVHEPVWE